jgi:hypothetical protein
MKYLLIQMKLIVNLNLGKIQILIHNQWLDV